MTRLIEFISYQPFFHKPIQVAKPIHFIYIHIEEKKFKKEKKVKTRRFREIVPSVVRQPISNKINTHRVYQIYACPSATTHIDLGGVNILFYTTRARGRTLQIAGQISRSRFFLAYFTLF